MFDLPDSKILVTGARGFLGRHLIAHLQGLGCGKLVAPSSQECDLRSWDQTEQLIESQAPDLVIHLAAVVGGIAANQRHPGKFFYENAIMGIQLMEIARLCGVKKFVTVGTVCAYPKFTPTPFCEESLWDGYPEETNAPYGLAKKMLLVQGQAYRQEYAFNSIYLLPTNLYGPGDNYDPESSHVIPAMIHKFAQAKASGQSVVELWGDGSPTREFLYVKDAARGIALAAQHYDEGEPVNLGSGQEASIKELAERVAHEMGYAGKLVWDTSKPNGQPRRCLDLSRSRAFGFEAQTSLSEGLRETLVAYRASFQ